MNNRQHIQKKHPSQSTYTPVQNLYQTRAFDIQQQPSHSSSGQENVDLDADHEQSQYKLYNLPYIPVNAPGTEPPPPIQTQLNSGEPTNYYQQGSADVAWYNRPTYPNIPVNAPGTEPPPPIQTKLTIGQPGDKYEQEADQVASQVVQQINSPVPVQSAQGQTVQREDAPPEEEEQLQAKSISDTIQRQEAVPEEDELQTKPDITALQRRDSIGGGDASTDVESAINTARGGGQPLDGGLQRSMGKAMGADFSGVKVHTDSQADQLNQSIQAKAFTTGQDVFFRKGTYQPGSKDGQELIAHELTHVVQQNGGTVQRSLQNPIQLKCETCEAAEQEPTIQTKLTVSAPINSLNGAVIQKIGEPLTAKAKVKPAIGETKGEQRKYGVDQYVSMWEAEQGRKMTPEEKKTLARGCIGITALDLEGGGNPPLNECYGSFDQAKAAVDKKNKDIDFWNTLEALAIPSLAHLFQEKHRAVLFAKLFWSNQNPDKDKRKVEDKNAFKPDPKTGKVNMTGYKYREKGGGNFVNFDYGFWDEASQSFWHANHSEPGMEVYQSTKEKFAKGYADFDRVIYCVAIAKNYDPQKAAKTP